MTIPTLHKNVKKFFSKKYFVRTLRVLWWFSLGAVVGLFFFISFLYISYRQTYANLVYEGVMVNGIDFGGKTQDEVRMYFGQKNKFIRNASLLLKDKEIQATISAREIDFGYDEQLLAQQAFSVARSNNIISNMSLLLQAYSMGVHLAPAYHYKEDKLNKVLLPIQQKIDVKPVDAQFSFEDGRVNTFKLSSDGKAVNIEQLKKDIITKLSSPTLTTTQINIITIPVEIKQPNITTEKINNMGIKEIIGRGTSLFQHSIENRIFNLTLAASRLNGVLIPPGQTFSVTKTIGDVSAFTGYKQAYVIENGKTVLGDGGGVCQVSTTLFRAALNAGLPIVERHPHAYRVGYYEQDSLPGIDAAIYSPTVDLKFKNDTKNYILIQSFANQNEQRLTFELYGTLDDRETILNEPVIVSESAAPETVYQDDPTLPKGQLKQVDFAAGGANIYFTRTVKKDGKVILSDKFVSNYRPWQAVFLRGTKE